MRRITRRAGAIYLLVLLVVGGLLLYVIRWLDDGGDWAAFRANKAVYADGVLDTGTLTDRNGLLLARAGDGIFRYADDAETRRACFQAVGDYAGNVGTGALTVFARQLIGYTPLTGTYSPDGSGGTVALSLDADLCRTAYAALAGRNGAVLLMDYTTGEILCMVSSPSCDPCDTASAADGVYLNRCLSAAYTPGSVFKIVTLCAALETLDDLSGRSFTCTGSLDVQGNTVTCSGTHGTQTIEQAFANSCNCAFAQLAQELGAETIGRYAQALGITGTLELDGIVTAAGSYDSTLTEPVEVAWSGIGQSTDLVCPFAMLRLCAAIANDGVCVTPTLLLGGSGESTRRLAADTARTLSDDMNYNVVWHYGQGSFPGLSLCAKTGTAELGDGTSHAWFTGFLLDEDHPYAFTVVIEHGGGGLSAAGSLANTLLQAAVNP